MKMKRKQLCFMSVHKCIELIQRTHYHTSYHSATIGGALFYTPLLQTSLLSFILALTMLLLCSRDVLRFFAVLCVDQDTLPHSDSSSLAHHIFACGLTLSKSTSDFGSGDQALA